MKRICLIGLVIVSSLILASCGGANPKTVKKMLEEKNENSCSDVMRAVLDEIENADNYQLDGEECVLNYEGRVENAISNCIKFHKENHTFVAKNGKFDEKQWNNWMYYYYNPGKVKNPEDYITSCFICLEMAEQKDKWNFHNSLENCSREDLIANSYYARILVEKSEQFAEEKILDAMFDDIKSMFVDLPESVKITKERDWKKFYVYLEANDIYTTVEYLWKERNSRYDLSLEAVIAKYDGITSTNTLDHYSDFDSIRMLGVLYQALERYE